VGQGKKGYGDMMERLDLSALKNAAKSLEATIGEAHNVDFMDRLNEVQRRAIIAGAIQNFEVTYELCWKFLKRWLEHNLGRDYVEGITRSELFRFGAEHRLIDDVGEWMLYHRARNQTSHTYDEETAQEVFKTASDFVHSALSLLERLEARND